MAAHGGAGGHHIPGQALGGVPGKFHTHSRDEAMPLRVLQSPLGGVYVRSGGVQKYLAKISGPLFDRIDIHIEVVPVPFRELSEARPSESSEAIRSRVMEARGIQEKRFAQTGGIHCNAQMSARMLRKVCVLHESGNTILKNAMEKMCLSARAFDRILKVSRTIADLDGSESIRNEHLAEAINYRSPDWDSWGR